MSGEHLDEPLDYLYEELPPERMAEVRRHLAECPECRAEMRAIRDAVKTYRLAPRPSTPPGLAARATARALGEVAAERHAPAPAPAKKAENANFISEEKFEQEFARLKQEVMGEMKKGWRTWFTHPAWVVATGAFFVCIILIHVSPRMKRPYEQILPASRQSAPRRESVERTPPPAPAAGPERDEEMVAAEPSATLLQAEAMSEALDVAIPEPESSVADSSAPVAPDAAGMASSVETVENTAPPAAAKRLQAAPVTAGAASDMSQPIPGPVIQQQEVSTSAPEPPKPAPEPEEKIQVVSESPSSLRPPAQESGTAVAGDEASAPVPPLEIPTLPESAPAARPEAARPASIAEEAHDDRQSAASAVPVTPPAAPAPSAPAEGASLYGSTDGLDLSGKTEPVADVSEAPATPAAVPAPSTDSGVASEQSAPSSPDPLSAVGAASAMPAPPVEMERKEAAAPIPGDSYDAWYGGMGDSSTLSSSSLSIGELPQSAASVAASPPIIADSPSGPTEDAGASVSRYESGSMSYGSPETRPHSAYADTPHQPYSEVPAPSVGPSAGFAAPEADLFAPVSPRARSAAGAPGEAAASRSPAPPEYAAPSAPPPPASPSTSATEILDATGGPEAVPQIVRRPTPVDRAESARNLTTLAALALAEGNIAEAWEAVRMLRSIDPKAAEQVAKWITELEEARLAAESEAAGSPVDPVADSAPAQPYAIQEIPPAPASLPTPMETVEPPENPPLTEVQVPAHMAPPGAVPSAAPARRPVQPERPIEPEPLPPASAAMNASSPEPDEAPVSESDQASEASEEKEPAEDQPAAAPVSRRPPGSSSLWYGTVGRDIRPLGPSRPQPSAPVMGRRPGTGKPFTTDPYLRDD